jgi:copper chaperone CopZ
MGIWNRVNLLLVAVTFLMLALLAFAVRPDASADQVALLQVESGGCAGCAGGITGALDAEKGVVSARVEEASGRVVVAYCSNVVSPETLAHRVSDAGYCCSVRKIQTVAEYRAAGGDPADLRGVRKSCCSWRGK